MNDLSEKEQIEAIRSWWQENGKMIVAGLVLGIGGLVVWNQWQQGKIDAAVEASALFQDLGEAVDAGKVDKAESAAAELYAEYGASSYAAQARLAMARLYMGQGRDEDAAKSLRDLLALDGSAELQDIARIRLGKILLYQGKAQEVIDMLLDQTNEAFAARYAELRGDAYVALASPGQAADAYAEALQEPAEQQTVDRVLIQMKINDLAQAAPLAPTDIPTDIPTDTPTDIPTDIPTATEETE